MKVTLSQVFNKHLGNTKFDKRLAKAIYNYQIGYVNSNREYLEFYGSNLLGVHVIRFKDSDVLKLYNDVLNIDYEELNEDIKTVTDINQEFKISSDVFNLTIMYLIHRFMSSPLIDDRNRHRALIDCSLLFFYRTIAALISYSFKFPADPKAAQAAYSNLSNKYLIKKLGSWHKLVMYRSEQLISKKSIHYKGLLSFKDDLLIVYAINDSQGRIKDVIKNYYSELVKVVQSGERIGVTSSTYLDIEGKESVKEKTVSAERYVSYIQGIISDKHSFIKDDLVNIIARINTNSNVRIIRNTLNWLSDAYSVADTSKDVNEFVSLVIIQTFYLIDNEIRPSSLRNYPMIIGQLKGLYLSSRSTDPDLMRIRELGEKLVRKASDKEYNNSLVMATRTSVILYISLRVLVGANR